MTSSSNAFLTLPPASRASKSTMSESKTITCSDLQAEIRRYTGELGYRLDMIMPADDPREATVSRQGGSIRLIQSSKLERPDAVKKPQSVGTPNEWTIGRAGMMYRDLIADRTGGNVIASHIRIVGGGEVPDSVHYHKIDFQIIYCLKGAIRVVYEDQGPPFWLMRGDCVLQPPEIRHRVLEAEAGSEVIEITSPAEHETWFDHEMELPTGNLRPERVFEKQRFVRHLDTESRWLPLDENQTIAARTEIGAAGVGSPDVYTVRVNDSQRYLVEWKETMDLSLKILVGGRGVILRAYASKPGEEE